MLDNISLFIAVVEAGSFKSASETLSIPPSTIGRHIKTLEAQLACKLLNRNSHTFEMTREGKKLYEETVFHVSSINSIISELLDDISGNKGPIKVLAPTNLMASCIQEPLSHYLSKNPEIQLELELSNRLTNFYSSNADIAIRVGKQNDSDLTQLKIGTINTVLVASPQYLSSVDTIQTPEDLNALNTIVTNTLMKWELYRYSNPPKKMSINPEKKLKVNDLHITKQWVMNGLGIALLPLTEVKTELKNNTLIRVLPNWQGENRDVYIIWYRRQFLSKRASNLIDYLKNNINF